MANPFLANTVEWFHAWVSVSGALLVGWTIGRAGHAKAGLSLFLLAALALAVVTIAQGGLQVASGNFGPVYVRWPYDMHKNLVGTLLAFGAITAYVRPPWMGGPTLGARRVLDPGRSGRHAVEAGDHRAGVRDLRRGAACRAGAGWAGGICFQRPPTVPACSLTLVRRRYWFVARS
ncbi:MAG: hypothetical protein IPO80_11590 [Propionibacteriaceae bacterium]|nr:hypothetical protein [Propionibacteriaceae bacterium]